VWDTAALTLPVLNVTALTETGGDPVVTKYYHAAGKRVAMSRDGVVQWLVGDHGSSREANCLAVWRSQTARALPAWCWTTRGAR
jgi:hypothetical protein